METDVLLLAHTNLQVENILSTLFTFSERKFEENAAHRISISFQFYICNLYAKNQWKQC